MTEYKIILIGLGNHPDQYRYTRHNIAKDFFLYLSDRKMEENKWYSYFNQIINDKDCLFIVPKSYMNVSGDIFKDQSLKNTILKGKSKVVIFHDDLEIPFGEFKLRNNKERGERGHNGNRSIVKILKDLQSKDYVSPYYVSLGIGRSRDIEVDSWVLKKFSTDEIVQLEEVLYPEIKKELSFLLNQI